MPVSALEEAADAVLVEHTEQSVPDSGTAAIDIVGSPTEETLQAVPEDESIDEQITLEDDLEDVSLSNTNVESSTQDALETLGVESEALEDVILSEGTNKNEAVVEVTAEPVSGDKGAKSGDDFATSQTTALTAQASTIASGTCGTCKWSIDASGCLTISAGRLSNDLSGTVNEEQSYYNPPWRDYDCRTLINKVTLAGKVQAGTSLSELFYNCDNLRSANLANLDTSKVTDMSRMFSGCESLTGVNLTSFNTSRLQRMDDMFSFCKNLKKLDLSSFDTSKVLSATYAFVGCSSLASFKVGTKYAMSRTDMIPSPTAGNSMWWSTKTKKWLKTNQITSSRSKKEDTYKSKTSIKYAKVTIPNQTYTGKAIKPDLQVKCGADTLYFSASYPEYNDYKRSFKNNKKIGTATVILKGRGDYTGTKKATFKIVPIQIKGASIAYIAGKYYRGKAYKPSPKVTFDGKTLKKGRDYTLSYKKNKNAGTATVIVKGKGNYAGTQKRQFTIYQEYLSKASVSGIGDQAYTGQVIKPSPVVKVGKRTLKKGTDYTLRYYSNVDPGYARIEIRGKGNYTGSKYVYFKIVR